MQAGRAAQAAVSACARALSSTAASAAVPATVTQSSGPFGFFAKKAAIPPMNVPLDGVDPVSPAPVPTSTPPTETSSLSNGVRVGAQEVMNPLAAIALVVESGSVYETAATEGASQLLQGLAFRGTANRSHFATVRQAENYGVTLQCMASREATIYYATAPRDNIAAAIELLADSAMRPAMQQHTLDEVKAALKKQNNDAVADPLFVASEGVVSAAYSGPLARPALWSGADIDHHTLADFHSTCFTPANTTLACSGAPLATVEGLAAEFLADLPAKAAPAKAPSTYVGGGSIEHLTQGAAAVLAFETSGWASVDESILSTVVTYLLGGGSDFSTGGPGKGMHSRLYQRVLVRNTWVSHCAGYSNIFENTGLTGIVASTAHADKGAELPGLICTELEQLAKGVSSEEVERAKAMCEAAVYSALEQPHIVAEDIGRQLITYGRRVPVAEFKERVQAIDASAVQKFVGKLLSGKVSGILLGDQAIMPKFDSVAARFGS